MRLGYAAILVKYKCGIGFLLIGIYGGHDVCKGITGFKRTCIVPILSKLLKCAEFNPLRIPRIIGGLYEFYNYKTFIAHWGIQATGMAVNSQTNAGSPYIFQLAFLIN